MKQQINLVNLALLPPKPFFQFKTMMLSLALIAVALVLSEWVLQKQLQLYAQTAAGTQQRMQAKQIQLKNQEDKLVKRQKDPRLTEELDKLTQEQKKLQQIANQLEKNGLTGEKKAGYAELLFALAQKPTPGLWLSNIKFDGMHVSLEGMTTSSALLPDYLAQLNQLAPFKGQRFSDFELSRSTQATNTASTPFSTKAALSFRLESISEEKKP